MSRQNKVNPGQYTQRGRLTQDDAARELRQQRSTGSQHTWQPVQKDQMPRPRVDAKDNDADRNETANDHDDEPVMSSSSKAKPAARKTRTSESKKAEPVRQRAKPSKTAKPNTATMPGKAKAAKSAKPAKRAATKTARKAVLARNVGGGGPKPRNAAKRRKN